MTVAQLSWAHKKYTIDKNNKGLKYHFDGNFNKQTEYDDI